MDKVFSARIDESALARLELLTRHLNTTKKDVLERAIKTYAELVENAAATDVLAETRGAWNRQEQPEAIVAKARKSFRQSFEKHRR